MDVWGLNFEPPPISMKFIEAIENLILNLLVSKFFRYLDGLKSYGRLKVKFWTLFDFDENLRYDRELNSESIGAKIFEIPLRVKKLWAFIG